MPWTKPDTADAAWAVRVRRLMSVMHRGKVLTPMPRAHTHTTVPSSGESRRPRYPATSTTEHATTTTNGLVIRVATWGTTSAASTPHAEYSATMEPPSAALPPASVRTAGTHVMIA